MDLNHSLHSIITINTEKFRWESALHPIRTADQWFHADWLLLVSQKTLRKSLRWNLNPVFCPWAHSYEKIKGLFCFFRATIMIHYTQNWSWPFWGPMLKSANGPSFPDGEPCKQFAIAWHSSATTTIFSLFKQFVDSLNRPVQNRMRCKLSRLMTRIFSWDSLRLYVCT